MKIFLILLLIPVLSLSKEYRGVVHTNNGDRKFVFGDFKNYPGKDFKTKDIHYKYYYVQNYFSFLGIKKFKTSQISGAIKSLYQDDENFLIAMPINIYPFKDVNYYSTDYLFEAVDWDELNYLNDFSQKNSLGETKKEIRYFLNNTALDYTFNISLIPIFSQTFKKALIEIAQEDFFSKFEDLPEYHALDYQVILVRRKILSAYFYHGRDLLRNYEEELLKSKVKDFGVFDKELIQYRANLIITLSILSSTLKCDVLSHDYLDSFLKRYSRKYSNLGEQGKLNIDALNTLFLAMTKSCQ